MNNHANIETEKILNEFIDNSDNNFFVLQIGANDGKMADPVYKFVKLYKWRGLFVEPVTYLFERLVENYKECDGLRFENSVIAKTILNKLISFNFQKNWKIIMNFHIGQVVWVRY